MPASRFCTRRYVHGPGDDAPLVWYEGSGTPAFAGAGLDKRWLHADERGSIVAISNASGNAIAINRYDEYGIPASTNVGRFQYTGQAWIPELGMYYYKARIYSPTLGRFLQTDPIGYEDGLNWYDYVGGDPVNRTDPTGLAGEEEGNEGPPLVVTACGGKPANANGECGRGNDSGVTKGGPVPWPSGPLSCTSYVCAKPAPPRVKPKPQSEKPSTLENVWECTKDQYGFGGDDGAGDAAAGVGRGVSEALAPPLSKELLGVPRYAGTSKWTNAINYASYKTRIGAGVNFLGRAGRVANFLTGTARVASVLGRANMVTGALFAAYDAGSIAYCAYKKGGN